MSPDEITTIGPECFTNGTVICYKGENYTRQPRAITTLGEVEALGFGATILSATGCVWVNDGDIEDEWASLGESDSQGGPLWRGSVDIELPATVLHER